jgi:capsid protein
MAQVLPPGFKAMQFSPEYPSAMHDSFNKSMLKEVSAGWNIAFASMSNDLSEANYSSNRVGLLDERSHWKAEQQEFTDKILSRIFPHWLEMALLTQIDLPDFKFEKFNSATWTGRKWDWIDPESDLNSIQTELYMRLKSPFDLAAERGEDFEQILQDFAEAKKLAEKYGVALNYDDPKIVVAEKKNETPPATNGKALALNGAGHLH